MWVAKIVHRGNFCLKFSQKVISVSQTIIGEEEKSQNKLDLLFLIIWWGNVQLNNALPRVYI